MFCFSAVFMANELQDPQDHFLKFYLLMDSFSYSILKLMFWVKNRRKKTPAAL